MDPRGVDKVHRRVLPEDCSEKGVTDLTGVRVCKVRDKFCVLVDATLYRTLTSLRGQRLFPGRTTEGYDALYRCTARILQNVN